MRLLPHSSLSLAQGLMESEDSFSDVEKRQDASNLSRRERLGSLILDCFKDVDGDSVLENEEAFKSMEKSTPTFENQSLASKESFNSKLVETGSSGSQDIPPP